MYDCQSSILNDVGMVGVRLGSVKVKDLTPLYRKQTDSPFPVVLDPVMLADVLGIKKRTVYWASNPYCQSGHHKDMRKPRRGLYHIVAIEKRSRDKNGNRKKRYLQIPDKRLMYIQKKLKTKIFDKVPLPDYVTGFRKGKGIVDTAAVHCNKSIVVSIDIADYFNSIHQWHLQKMFQEMFSYTKKVSKIISEICTYKYFVPQGAPSSPTLSNLVGHHYFDKQVKEIADRYGFVMTRYADDITLSTDQEYPKELVTSESGADYVVSGIDKMVSEIDSVLKKSKFRLNRRKTKVMRGEVRKYVVGIVTNKEPNIIMKKYRSLRCILHNLMFNSIPDEAAKTGRTEYEFLAWLRGNLNFLNQVNPRKGTPLLEKLDLILKAKGYKENIQQVGIIN